MICFFVFFVSRFWKLINCFAKTITIPIGEKGTVLNELLQMLTVRTSFKVVLEHLQSH